MRVNLFSGFLYLSISFLLSFPLLADQTQGVCTSAIANMRLSSGIQWGAELVGKSFFDLVPQTVIQVAGRKFNSPLLLVKTPQYELRLLKQRLLECGEFSINYHLMLQRRLEEGLRSISLLTLDDTFRVLHAQSIERESIIDDVLSAFAAFEASYPLGTLRLSLEQATSRDK